MLLPVIAGIVPVVIAAMGRKNQQSWMPMAICLLVLVGVVVARYPFYAAI